MLDQENHCSSCNTHRSELEVPPYALKDGGILCQPCNEKENKAKIEAYQATNPSKWDHTANEDIVCPHCGFNNEADSDDYDENTDYTCGDCEETFICSPSIVVTYTTKKHGE